MWSMEGELALLATINMYSIRGLAGRPGSSGDVADFV
jgi:hypothetical protein